MFENVRHEITEFRDNGDIVTRARLMADNYASSFRFTCMEDGWVGVLTYAWFWVERDDRWFDVDDPGRNYQILREEIDYTPFEDNPAPQFLRDDRWEPLWTAQMERCTQPPAGRQTPKTQPGKLASLSPQHEFTAAGIRTQQEKDNGNLHN